MRNAEVIRQWQILREVESRRTGVTIHELAKLVKVSTRTIRRDLQALQEAGFAVFDEGEENETKRWKLDAQPFKNVQEGLSVGDVAALYLSRAVVEGRLGMAAGRRAARGVRRKSNAGSTRACASSSRRCRRSSRPRPGPRAQQASGRLVDVTRRLLDAVRDRRVVDMRYFSASSNRAKSYAVHPYRLALAQGGVYLVAWVPHYDEFRTFALERIERLTVGEETFRKTRELPQRSVRRVDGRLLGRAGAHRARVRRPCRRRTSAAARGTTRSASTSCPTAGSAMTLDVSNDWALRSWVLGFGASVRVVKPAALADAVLDELKRACHVYEPKLDLQDARPPVDVAPPLPI